MHCKTCGRPNDTDSNFCKYCGDNLKEATDIALNPHGTIFSSQPRSNAELGYLIIAMMIFANVCLWLFWTFIFTSVNDNNGIVFKAMRMFSFILTISEFVVMFIFTKRQSYRIVIGVIAAIVIIYNLYYLITLLTKMG